MTNKKKAALLRDARYELSASDEMTIERTLNTLPKIKRKTMKEKVALATTAVAAIALTLVLVTPPIVQAVGELIDRVFGDRIERIEEYTALPEDEKVRLMAEELAMHMRGHALTDAKVEFENTTIEIPHFDVLPPMNEETDKTFRTRVTYTPIPGFDPNYIDFALELNGKTYPMAGGNESDYRKEGKVLTTEEEWYANRESWTSNTWLNEGILTTYLFFPIDPSWTMEEKTELVMTGTIDGKTFSIPFTFDPVKADEENLMMAKENVEIQERMNAEDKEKLTQYAEQSIPLNVARSAQDYDFMISEMSFVDSNLYLTVSYRGIDTTLSAKEAGMTYWLDRICIDGKLMSWQRADNENMENEQFSMIYEFEPNIDVGAMTGESLIMMEICLDSYDNKAPIAFRYNWDTKTVTNPKDADEEKTWIAESKSMVEALEKAFPMVQTYDLSDQKLSQTIDGMTISVTGATLWDDVFDLAFTMTGGEHGVHSVYMDGTARFDGKVGQENGSGYGVNGEIQSAGFTSPIHYSEFGNNTKISVSLPFDLYDKQDQKVKSVEFTFEFTLDRESMSPEVTYAKDIPQY